MKKQELITAIDGSAREVEALASPLNEGQLNAVPYPNSWTAAQLLRHLIKSEDLMIGGLESAARPATREITQRVPELEAIFLDKTNRLNAPDAIVPESVHYGKAAILDEWRETLSHFNRAAEAAAEDHLVENLPLGPITKIEILYFVLFHTQRHLIQMKKITAALAHRS